MDRERENDDTLPGSLQSLRGEYAEIQQIYWERRSDMPQAQVTMDVGERVFAHRLDPDLDARVNRGQHAVALALVSLNPLLPTERGHPEAVDQHYGVGSGRIGGVVD
jgi:hypothetical protein